MLYRKVYEELEFEILKNGYANSGQEYEIEIALIYLAMFNDSDELTNHAKQIIKNTKIDKAFQKEFKSLVQDLQDKDFRELIRMINEKFVNRSFGEVNSEVLSNLSLELLNIKNGDVLLDFGCSYGSFLASANKYSHENRKEIKMYFGVDLNSNAANVCKMIFKILRIPGEVLIGDFLNDKLPTFSKGFVFPPLGKYLDRKEKYKSIVFSDVTLQHNNYGWLFVDRLISQLGENKKAIALLPLGALFNEPSDLYRKSLLRAGYIEGIIELPSGSLRNTGVQMALVILSTNNKSVKYIKVEDNFINNSKKLMNERIDISKIADAYNDDKCDKFPVKDLLKLNTLLYSAAINKSEDIKNGRKLSEVSEVFPGAQYTISKFKDSISNKPTERQIVVSSDIEDGTVDWESLPFIEGFEHFDKYEIHKGDLIITSKSSKVKIAYVEIEPKNKIIVTGGMLIVRPQKDLDGTFLKIYLESEDGQRALKSIQKGSVITSMNAKDLQRIIVPVPPIKEQQVIANKYNSKLSTLLALKEEIKKIENQLQDFYRKEVIK